MRATWALAVASFLLVSFEPAQSQSAPTTVQRDSTAVTLLEQSIAAMGGAVPSDSTFNGTVTYTAGSLTETGTIQVMTRGSDQTFEQIVTPHVDRTIVYSRSQASVATGDSTKTLPLQAVATSQSVDFPLPFLAAASNNPDIAIQYVGLETLAGSSVQHIRLWNTFNSQPSLQSLSTLTMRDIWFDSTSTLPMQIAYGSWANTFENATIPVIASYSNYQTVSGYAYPASISVSVSGTPAISASIQSIKFNTDLSDTSFPIQSQGAAQ